MVEERKRYGGAGRAAVGGALILAGLGAGVAGAFAASTSGLVRGVGAGVGAVAGLAAAIWVDRASERREGRRAAVRAREKVLDATVADPAAEGSVFDAMLATSTKAPPFRGRRDDLAWLERWWDDPKQPAIAMVTGPAGIGKTRLVTQFAQDRPASWVTGWLSSGRGADAVAAIRGCADPALLLVDDADQRPDLAAFLVSLKAARDARPAVRAILISRGTCLVSRLAATLDDSSRAMLDGVGELPLGLFGGADDRARWFTEAVRAYARARQVPPPDLPAHLDGFITDPAEPILTLHAQALLAVLDSEESRPIRPHAEGPPFDRVAAALFAHEQYRWRASAQQRESGLTDLTGPVQAHAIAALLLASPVDDEQAAEALRRLPELASTALAERRANIARWAARLYPGDPPWPIRIKPDMLAEWFVVTQTPELAELPRVMTPAQESELLVLLAHAGDHMPQAVQLFADVVAADTTRLAGAGVAAAMTASTGRRRLDGELARLIPMATWSSDALGHVEKQLTDAVPRAQAAVADARVQIARTGSDAASLAWALINLRIRLAVLGRYQESLPVAEEAVGLLRPLARDNPAHQPSLARALTSLGIRLGMLGRDEEALAAAEEAVGMWRPLARDNPAHQPDLARALDDLGLGLGALGREQDGLAAAKEAIGMWRPLARDNRAHQPSLPKALTNLENRLSVLGRDEEALAAAEEAIGMWRPLARDNRAHQPDLARALTNFGISLGVLGRDDEALAAAEEAVGLWRPLARDNPAHEPSLPKALTNLGNSLRVLGRDDEALAAAEEALGLWRRLAQNNPGLYQKTYDHAVAQLRRDLLLRGQESASIFLHLADESLTRDKPAGTVN